MAQGENTSVVQYRANNIEGDLRLEIRPLVAFRDFHSTTHENNAIDGRVSFANGLATISPYHDLPQLYLAHNASRADAAGDWYRNFEYQEELRRGLDFREDLFHPLTLIFDLALDPAAIVIASTRAHRADESTHL